MRIRMALSRAAWAGVVAGLLAGCVVGPDYRRPEVATPDGFLLPSGTRFDTQQVEREFWARFQEPLLTELIEDALRANHDVRIALARLSEARALHGEARLDAAPTVTAFGAVTEARFSERQQPDSSAERAQDIYEAGFDAAWELDLFGRVRRGIQARAALVQAAQAELDHTQVTITAEVARNYFELRGAQQRLEVALRNAANQEESLRITRARLEGGRGTQLDVARAQSLLSATRARIPELRAEITVTMLRLGVLTGQHPQSLMPKLTQVQPLPALPSTHRVGTPEMLLRRRPDIRIAERELAAQTARIGIAVADLFPRISFIGRWGVDATSSGALGESASEAFAFGPSIRWAAFDLGRVRQRIHAREAAAQAALASYEQRVLRALEETDASMTRYVQAIAEQEYLRQSARSAAEAAAIARARFENGVADFLTVLDAERTMLEAEDRLSLSETRTATSLLSMYKALGGGFRSQDAHLTANR